MTALWTLHPVAALGPNRDQWNHLNRELGNLPFLDADIVALMCRYFGTGREHLAICCDGTEVVAAAVLVQVGAGRWQTFQPAQAAIGAWLQRPQCDLPTLVKGLMRVLLGPSLALGITQQDPELLPRPPQTSTLQTMDYIETSRVSVNSSFQSYWEARGSNLRQGLKKQRNRLAREGLIARLEEVTDDDRIGDAVDDYARLESAGWKGQEGTALHPANAQGEFYRQLFQYCARRGEASVYRYFLGDELVASDLCVHRNGVLVVLKTAYSAADKTLSPSLLMKEKVFERLFADGRTRRIEFYGRVMEWHRRWTSEIRTMYHINAYRWGWLGKLHGLRRAPELASPRSAREAKGAGTG
jgi:Acetyltransferase (GNAT) domain